MNNIMLNDSYSGYSGRALPVPNRRAPQHGLVSLPSGTGTGIPGTGTVIGTGVGTGTGTAAGVSTTTGVDSGSGTTISLPTGTPSITTSDLVSTTSPTSLTTTVPSTTVTPSSTTTTSTTTTSKTTTSRPLLTLTDSRHPFTTSTIFSTFVSTLPNGEVQSFTTPIPTALVSSSPNTSTINRTTTIVASTVSAFVFLVLLVLAVLFIWRRKGLKLRTRSEQREKGKEMRRLLEDEDFSVDDEDRWSGFGQNRNFAPSLNSGFGGPTLLRPISPVSPLRIPMPIESSGQQPLVPQAAVYARTSSTSTSTSSSPPSTHRPSSSNSTLLPPPSPQGTLRGYSSQEKSSLQLTPVPSSSSSPWISRPISATLPPYRDPFGVGPPLLPQATLLGISPKTPVTTKSPLSPPPKSFVASPQSPGEWLKSPKSPTFAQAAAITMTTVDTPTPAAADADAAASQRSTLHRKHSTADSVYSVADSVSEYSQESAPLHVLLSRLAQRSGEPPPPVPPIPLMSPQLR